MAFKIERALSGIFGAFRLQSQGNLPIVVREDVQPVLDLNPWALQAMGVDVVQMPVAPTPAAIGIVTSYTQEDDWLVVGANFYQNSTGVGDITVGELSYARGNGAPSHTVCCSTRPTGIQTAALAIGERMGARLNHFAQPFFTPRGTVWTLSFSYLVGVPNVYASVAHYRLNP